MTSKPDLKSQINAAIAEEFELDIEELHPDAHLVNDLELDSLDFVDLAVVLKNTCGVSLANEEEEMRKVRTMGDLHAFIEKLLEKNGKL